MGRGEFPGRHACQHAQKDQQPDRILGEGDLLHGEPLIQSLQYVYFPFALTRVFPIRSSRAEAGPPNPPGGFIFSLAGCRGAA